MARTYTGVDVLTAARERIDSLYAEGHRVVVSYSGGKDSTVILELCIEAATRHGALPVEVVAEDEELAYPGTFELWERTAARAEVDFHWLWTEKPHLNCYNRAKPYWWGFDSRIPQEEWFHIPPEWATYTEIKNIQSIINTKDFPPADGKELVNVLGLRAEESAARTFGIHASGSWLTKHLRDGVRVARPIYDWSAGDVWRAIADHGWDYCKAYDVFAKMGMTVRKIRLGPPTQTPEALDQLQYGALAWPQWFDKVCERLPGVRAAANYGKKALIPKPRLGESWEDCFYRTCIMEAPQWIRDRATNAMEATTRQHTRHSTMPFPDVQGCKGCNRLVNSWKALTRALYLGDPYATRYGGHKPVEPEFFREGAGTWDDGGPGTW